MSCLGPNYLPNPSRLWYRYDVPCPATPTPFVQSMLYPSRLVNPDEYALEAQMIYKGNLLQHANNSVKLTKQQRYASAVSKRTRNLSAYVRVGGQNIFLASGQPTDLPVTGNDVSYDQVVIQSGGTYIPKCAGSDASLTKCTSTSASGVSGKPSMLCWNRRYINWMPKRQVKMTEGNGKWNFNR